MSKTVPAGFKLLPEYTKWIRMQAAIQDITRSQVIMNLINNEMKKEK